MNLVIDDAVEVRLASKTEEEKRRELGIFELATRVIRATDMTIGQILLKGDNVSLIQALQ